MNPQSAAGLLQFAPIVALLIVSLLMVAELRLSTRNDRRLLSRGAMEPPDPVYAEMRWAYPAAFVAMAVEGMMAGPPPVSVAAAGAGVFVLAKALKYWAIATLGERWTFRVLVLPGAPLVASGPYRLMRHPNYVGVAGELVGMALLAGAQWTGPIGTLYFIWLMGRRVAAEERALGLR